eukprot:TRINITY_DN3445_c0_g3_i1.p1 TRINITY_DN3445_c0_g3~~TRINITY_DN3445_c0_g3_i1.p1  ORF type:complete len:474 (-),score=122.85 TRINITY_DN3445_c0_g3_i1:187-1539(-)
MNKKQLFVSGVLLVVSLAVCLAIRVPTADEVVITEQVPGEICDPTVQQYSGYVSIQTNGNKNLFYWFFESRRDPTTDPVTIWLTGGPGCSSLIALFTENGPCSVTPNGTNTVLNPYSWNTQSNIMWIDQPVQTGYSYGSPLDTDEAQVAADMYAFLQAWFKLHPEYQKQKFYVTGESYGGHYVPAVSNYIYQQNQQNPAIPINLHGVAIGNGLTDPQIQYLYYADYAQNNSVRQLVTDRVLNQMIDATGPCVQQIAKCNQGNNNNECSNAQLECNDALIGPVQATGVNLYDVRIPCAVPPLCYDFSYVDKFVTAKSTRDAIGVGTHVWHGDCNFQVNGLFSADWMHNFNTDIPALLEANMTVLIYAGDDDFICNYMGNKAWTLALQWSGQSGFNAAEDHPWNVEGVAAGIARSYDNFNFLQVFNAGHMVPRDQPANALAMINQFFDSHAF